MSLTGYNPNDLLADPGYMLTLRISPNVETELAALATRHNLSREQIIESLIESNFDYIQTDVDMALHENSEKNVMLTFFDEDSLAMVVFVEDAQLVGLLVNKTEGERIEGAIETGGQSLDLDWIVINLDVPGVSLTSESTTKILQ